MNQREQWQQIIDERAERLAKDLDAHNARRATYMLRWINNSCSVFEVKRILRTAERSYIEGMLDEPRLRLVTRAAELRLADIEEHQQRLEFERTCHCPRCVRGDGIQGARLGFVIVDETAMKWATALAQGRVVNGTGENERVI